MASWICSICSTPHNDHAATCVGCHHSGRSLEEWIDCPRCGLEVPVTDTTCARCFAILHPAEPDEFAECPECGEEYLVTDECCDSCGATFEEEEWVAP